MRLSSRLALLAWFLLLPSLLLTPLLLAACASPSAPTPQVTPIPRPSGSPSLSVTASLRPSISPSPDLPVTAPPPSFPSAQPTPVTAERPVMVADHAIAVTLDVEARALTGSQRLVYRNAASKPFDEMIFHLYLNAFKSLDTVFMQESGGALRGHEFDPESAGSIDITSARIAGGDALRVEVLEDGTLARLRLPGPVAPGASIELELTFSARLPRIFARTGWALDAQDDPFFLVAQWFPKPGVWTGDGWRADVFHGNAEFFADFGRYAVEITLPEGYVTGATGVPDGKPRPAPGGMQTVRYNADGVIDFAWVASPNLLAAREEAGGIPVEYLYLPEHAWSAAPTFKTAGMALSDFQDWFGPYPYPRLTIVDVPESGEGAGGMEYPGFITVGARSEKAPASARTGWQNYLEIVTAHEIAHQWWQSVVATDEGREPWLDEGFADYSTARLLAQRYGGLPFADAQRTAFEPGFLEGRRQAFLRAPGLPMLNTAWDTPYNQYVVASYAKPDMALLTLEYQLGEETMQRILSTYYERYRFAHPTTADFERVAVEVSGQPLDWFFDGLVRGDDTINWSVSRAQGASVTVEREGDLALPVDVAVTLATGTVEHETCPTEKTACTFSYHSPVREVSVDPQRKILVDTDWEDNIVKVEE